MSDELRRRAASLPGIDPLSPFGAWLRHGGHGRVLRATREHMYSVSHGKFVAAAFRALLGREPDEDGLRHFVHELDNGSTTREQVLGHIGRSAEAAALVVQGPGLRDHVEEFCARRGDVDPSLRPLCFVHLMKCGGTAFVYGLSTMADPWPRFLDIWVDQLVCLPQPLLAQSMLVAGHLPYAALQILPADTAACTVLREPVARTLSHFAHVRTHGRQTELTLEEFVGDEQWRPRWVNYQTRQLAHDVPVAEAHQGRFPVDAGGAMVTLQSLLDGDPPVSDGELLAVAADRLTTMEFVGVSDDLDALLQRIAAAWDKPPPAPLPRANTSLEPVAAAEVPASLLAEIRRGTSCDAELYTQAQARARSLSRDPH